MKEHKFAMAYAQFRARIIDDSERPERCSTCAIWNHIMLYQTHFFDTF